MDYDTRQKICDVAIGWLHGGLYYKPTYGDMENIFDWGMAPTPYAAADAHTKSHWCGIFACCCLRQAGVGSAHWGIVPSGWGVVGDPSQISKAIWGNDGAWKGDVGYINAQNHHFLIIDYWEGQYLCIDGNSLAKDNPSLGAVIQWVWRPASDISSYYQIQT